MHINRAGSALALLCISVLACSLPGFSANPLAAATTTPQPIPTLTPKPIDLTSRPQHWFAALPPQPGGPYDGSDDYMDLFQPGAPWEQASSYLKVYKLYGGWVARPPSQAALRQAIQAIRQRGLALAVEVGPLNPGEGDCGLYVEGFAGEEGVQQTVRRIKDLGGELNLIAFDEPYYYGHFYDGEHACHWTGEKIAKEIDNFIQQVRAIFPEMIIGDIEPLTGPADAQAYKTWLETFRAVNGYDLAFLHLDIDWSNTSWPQQVKTMVEYGDQLNVEIGMIYNGNPQDETDEDWLAIAGERVKRFESTGSQLDHVIFQSWHDRPDRALPDSDPSTFTGFLRTYFEDHSAIGFQAGTRANLALGKTVLVSNQVPGNEGQWVVDGDPGTVWNAGDGPPQWIEIDLGAAYDIRQVRLSINQYPPGFTTHRLLGKAPGGEFALLQSFDGETTDSQVLVFEPPSPVLGIQFIRVETTASPSWVSWREIEIMQ